MNPIDIYEVHAQGDTLRVWAKDEDGAYDAAVKFAGYFPRSICTICRSYDQTDVEDVINPEDAP